MAMLEIRNLHVEVEGNEILRGVDLTVEAGEVHAIMGPNGSGKSTLAQTLAGHEAYEVTQGDVSFLGHADFLQMPPEERARLGFFLAFQYPVEIPGISNAYFLQSSVNEIRKSHGLPELDAIEFQDLLAEKMEQVNVPLQFADRNVNEGFSGGEKKRNEILQMAVLEPRMCVLDETDSGLDIDALRIVSDGINKLRSKERGFILVTHYQRLLNYVKPDFVHVLYRGRLVKSGGPELATELEAKGYDWIRQTAAV
jgi:Fe-S cluster assembly ATP-binding protein